MLKTLQFDVEPARVGRRRRGRVHLKYLSVRNFYRSLVGYVQQFMSNISRIARKNKECKNNTRMTVNFWCLCTTVGSRDFPENAEKIIWKSLSRI